MGTPDFAAAILEALLSTERAELPPHNSCHVHDYEVVAVYSRPDAVSKRGKKLVPSAVSQLAQKCDLPLYRPRTLRDADAQKELAALKPDLIIVAAYGMILPKEVLDISPLGCVNVHASLLPRWRGAAPIERAILAGDKRTGVAIMQMEEGLDTGPTCAFEVVEVGEKSASLLRNELAHKGGQLLVDVLPNIFDGSAAWTIQNEDEVSYADKIKKEEMKLSPNLSVGDFVRRVRSSSDSAPAKLSVEGRIVTVLDAMSTPLCSVGKVMFIKQGGKRRVLLGCSDGMVELLRVKPDGKKEMHAADWLNGFPKKVEGLTWD